MRKLNAKANAIYLLYFGAFLVATEVGIEHFLSPLPGVLLSLARVLQLVGFLLIPVGLTQVIRTNRARQSAPQEEFIDVLRNAAKTTHAYIRDAFAHALASIAVILTAALYVGLYWWTTLSSTPRATYYLFLLTSGFLALLVAWVVPVIGLKREVDRINQLEHAEHA